MDRFVRCNAMCLAAAMVALAEIGSACAHDGPAPAAPSVAPRPAVADAPAIGLPTTSPGPLEQIVVLQDGGVLMGQVTRVGDRYLLARRGGETQIPVGNVMLVAKSLEDAFQQRQARLNPPTAEGLLQLADWCLNVELVAHAEEAIAEARRLDARNAKLGYLERRLTLAKEHQQRAKEPVKAPTSSGPSGVVQVSANEPAGTGDLPPGAVELFTRRVQPVLVNNCTTTGCHQQGGAQKFQLDRAVLRGLSNRRTTMSNLSATLALVNRDVPQLSPLLTIPRKTHGNMKGPIFGPRQEAAFRHLAQWVALVTHQDEKPPAETPAAPEAAGQEIQLTTATASGDGTTSRLASPVMREERQSLHQETTSADADEEVTPSDSAGETFDPLPPSQVRYGAPAINKWEPRDPFDPEIFNRQKEPREEAAPNIMQGLSTPADQRAILEAARKAHYPLPKRTPPNKPKTAKAN